MDSERLVAVQPKADFLPLLGAASPTWGLAGKALLLGDPEGARARFNKTILIIGADLLDLSGVN